MSDSPRAALPAAECPTTGEHVIVDDDGYCCRCRSTRRERQVAPRKRITPPADFMYDRWKEAE
jgi:hypothetical protein